MNNSNLIEFWLDQCLERQPYSLLEKHNYKHDGLNLCNLGSFMVNTSGKYFNLDENGSFYEEKLVLF